MMNEIEKFFTCPYCFQRVSMLLDTSVSGEQTYIEDCEVCCNPIEITFYIQSAKIRNFTKSKAQE